MKILKFERYGTPRGSDSRADVKNVEIKKMITLHEVKQFEAIYAHKHLLAECVDRLSAALLKTNNNFGSSKHNKAAALRFAARQKKKKK
jgi:hypothetical protein